ncbi:hypothetical protein HMPREF3169_05255 [Corynebacterium sp. HMSC08C04]|uniref:hypothetical protein n=1 Tax=Corynebacterium sp. HMSC08C04 TaxID=1581137 RepID=UPI0008A27E93|nr:hypothetical protein [Corynebacterium sp. HMSC08C04]OFT34651.1 hypothetical protein HMPREF3169_05255 [Corynebacterium sp. HMSC08C04]
MHKSIPLNGEQLINQAARAFNGAAVSTPDLIRLALEDAPDGTNGAVRSEPSLSKAVDPSQGAGYQRRAKHEDPLLDSLSAVLGLRSY